MFYSQFILAKKGPLGTIWIAAHLERKLRKNQVADTDIGVSVDSILFPEVPIALRLSSHLLLGVVRIYSRKVNYLFDDCSEALLKIKQAFRSAAVDLPPEQSKAPYHSITLPETFDLDDFELPDNELLQGNYVDHHVSTREQITLQDTMDGVAFSTSQFGPDERFGDGEASQIGLDLDEEFFLDKGEAAGTSGVLLDTDADPQASIKDPSPFPDDEHHEEVSGPSLFSPANYSSIQAPSTPGLMEEPNLPSAQEALVSDDHMDEDHNSLELAAKEVSGPASSKQAVSGPAFSQPEPSNLDSIEFDANGNSHHLDKLENDKARSQGVELSAETVELISCSNDRPPTPGAEAGNALDSVGDILNGSENDRNVIADIQSTGQCEVDEVGINGITMPLVESASVMEVHVCDPCAGSDRTDHCTYPPSFDSKSENNKPFVVSGCFSTEECDRIFVSSGSDPQSTGQPSLNVKNAETSESNMDEKSSLSFMLVLQTCNSHIHHTSNGVNNLVGASNFPADNDGVCSLGASRREDAPNVSGISEEVQDVMKPFLNGDQIPHEVTCANDNSLGGQLDNIVSDYHLAKDNHSNISDLPEPEKLLSMPNLPAGQSDNLLVECTPDKVLTDGDENATGDKIISGRKRSYTESTLTIQSINSAESSGAAQSKRSMDFVPDDNDLLSSILVGRRSTAFEMKPTPPVADTVSAKRQRVTVRANSHKRKVLVDDSMVLHGEMIRLQLTSTEDIRRVRKKAPCTRFEFWMVQKQSLEDEIFSEPVFTGMSEGLRSLQTEIFDVREIRIVEEDGSKVAKEMDTSTKPTLGEETESVGALTLPVTQGDKDRGLGGSLVETPIPQEGNFGIEVGTVEEIKLVDNGVPKEMSEHDVLGEKVGMEIGQGSVPVVEEANSIALWAEQASLMTPVSEFKCNLEDNAIVDSHYLNKSGDVEIDASCQVLDQRFDMHSAREGAPILDGSSGAGTRDQEGVDVTISEKLNKCERLGGEHLLGEMGSVETAIVMSDLQDDCSLPIHDASLVDSMPLESGACPTSNQVMEECQLDEPGVADEDEIFAPDVRHDLDGLTSNNLPGDDLELDSSCPVEADLCSGKTILTERENLERPEVDPMVALDSAAGTPIHVDIGDDADFETDAFQHDTDFLNVNDDEVSEDYESGMPNTEEKRILDNSGWSTRTRAVASYLQVLFEREGQHGKEDISLDNLLAGKSRKEASRMFFETLVLKTKDYVHAEQESSFCDVHLKPRGKLMQSEFRSHT